jgi:tetratricopeptide (TPR) repeat protein
MSDESDPVALSGPPGVALQGASRAEADASLRRWRDLLDLQIEEARREDKVRHWGLRIRHVSDVLKLGFELAIAFIVAAVAIGLAAAIWQAAHADGLVIESFNVPQAMAAKGLTGQVIAGKLLDKLTAMQNGTQSTRAASTYANDWTNDITVEIPDTGVSLGQVVRFLDGWLGHQMHLSGDVYETADGIALTARIGGDPGQIFTGRANDLDAVVARAAEAVYARAQPYRYTVYLGEMGRFEEAHAAALRLAQTGSPMDRVWAYVGLSYVSTMRGDAARAREYNVEGRRLDPHMWNLNDDLIDQMQDHEENELGDVRQEMTLLNAGNESGADETTVRLYRQLTTSEEASLLGDYQTALANDVVAPDVGANAVASNGALLAVSLHDAALMDRYLREMNDMPLSLADDADRDCVTGLARLAQQDWRGAIAQLDKAATEIRAFDAQTRGWFAAKPLITVYVAPYEAYAQARLGNFAKADAILAATPLDCDTCVLARGRVAAVRHDWSSATQWFAMVSARSPSIPFADADWGQMLMAKGDLDGAIVKFTAANQKGPHFADPLEMWGEALIAKNRSDLALAKFEEANKYAPNWGRLHLKWGEALYWSGDKADAAKQFAAAAALDLTPGERAELARVGHV